MIIEIGHYALILALATALVVSVVPVIGARRLDRAMMDLASVGALALFALVVFSFGVLSPTSGRTPIRWCRCCSNCQASGAITRAR